MRTNSTARLSVLDAEFDLLPSPGGDGSRKAEGEDEAEDEGKDVAAAVEVTNAKWQARTQSWPRPSWVKPEGRCDGRF